MGTVPIFSEFFLMIILRSRLFMEVNPMAQRRVEKPKKVKGSPKQAELYRRLGVRI